MNVIYHCYPGGKHKCLTFSYDDGRDQDRRLVSIFNKYGMKGTFNINGGLFDWGERVRPEEFPELYKGHEIACHTYSHPTIARCNASAVVTQTMEDRKILENIVGYPVQGLAYPNGSYSPEIISLLPYTGIKYARTVTSTMTFATPNNFLEWNPTAHHSRGIMKLGEDFKALFKTQYLYMFYVWGHSYEFDNNTENNNWKIIEEFCESMAGQDDIWYATNIEIVRDEEAFRRLIFTADNTSVYNPSFDSVWLNVNGNIVEVKGGEFKKF